jgi:hypothetical protein
LRWYANHGVLVTIERHCSLPSPQRLPRAAVHQVPID